MTRSLPALTEALEDWRDLTADRDAFVALFDFPALLSRYQRVRRRLDKLRRQPPLFDAGDLGAVLDTLYSAARMKSQIVEANDLEVLVPTLQSFLFDTDEPLADKLMRYPARIRYVGATILSELWGWAHLDAYPLFHQRAVRGIRRLGWQVPAADYLTFQRAFADLREFYRAGPRVDPRLPLHLEMDEFLRWVVDQFRLTVEPELPPLARRSSYAVREFGAPYAAAPAPLNTWLDTSLAPPTPEQVASAEARIREHLALPAALVTRTVGHLLAGRHVILTGVPGTGKSHLATLLTRELFGYYPMVVTANAEWSAFDVVGGLVPQVAQDGDLRYAIRPGVVYEALRRNWWLDEDGHVRRDSQGRPLRTSTEHESRQYPGVWLIIDELNRADVDKAFGDLFTALENGQLRVPRSGTEPSMLIPLPRDFRIIATLNSRDRHFLFSLSDALKRRFALVEVESPDDERAERQIVLARALSALDAANLNPNTARLQAALDVIFPVYCLLRAVHPLGTSPLLAALQYVGAVAVIDQRSMTEAVQDAMLAEVLPQLEGVRPLPLRFLAALFRGDRQAAFDVLHDALVHGHSDAQPFQLMAALANAIDPKLGTETATLSRAASFDPVVRNRAVELLDALRSKAAELPAPRWVRIAELLETWLRERSP